MSSDKVSPNPASLLLEFAVDKITDSIVIKHKTDSLEKGDILGVHRGVYEHYAVYLGDNRIIHYAGEEGDFNGSVEIREADIDKFLMGKKKFFKLDFEKYKSLSADSTVLTLINNLASCIDHGIFKEIKQMMDNKIIRTDLYSPEETIERAKSRLGEKEYSLTFNNCEHFAIWCKTGLNKSYQVDAVFSLLNRLPINL